MKNQVGVLKLFKSYKEHFNLLTKSEQDVDI